MDFCYESRSELYHHGILGQKWGIRRYQNEDGTWTSEGLKRRAFIEAKEAKKEARRIAKIERKKEKHPALYTAEELTKRIARLEQEKRYKDLYNDVHKSDVYNIGKDFIRKTLFDVEGIATKGAGNLVNWWTEYPVPLERIVKVTSKALESLGSAGQGVGKTIEAIKSGRKSKGDKDNSDNDENKKKKKPNNENDKDKNG